jgi:hypothetical protein
MVIKRNIAVTDAVWIATALLSYERYMNNNNINKDDIYFRQVDIVKRANELTEKTVREARTSEWCCADHEKHTHNYLRGDNESKPSLRRLTVPNEYSEKTYPINIPLTSTFALKDGTTISFERLLHFAHNEYTAFIGLNKEDFVSKSFSAERKEWIIPCNTAKYIIADALKRIKRIDWRQPTQMKSAGVGDMVYVYCKVQKSRLWEVQIFTTAALNLLTELL